MDMLRELLSSDAVHHLGWMLLHSLWLMLIPAGGLALAMLTLPKRMSNTRYIVNCAALLMLAGSLGVAALLVPDRVGALAEAEIKPVAEIEPATDPFAETPPLPPLAFDGVGNESPGPLDWMDMEGERSISPPPTGETALLPGMDTLADNAETNEAASGGSTGEASRQPQGWYARSVAAVEPYVAWAVPLWLLGVVALALWHLGGLIATHRLRSIGTRPAPYAARLQMQAIMGQMGVTRTVKLLESAVVHSPVVIGFLKPVVLVPVSVFAGLTPQQLEAILAHELAHIRRHDYLVNLVQTLIVTLLFYHPAVWWVSRQICNERECCCDDIVVRLTPAPGRSATDRKLDYAKALTQVALLRKSNRPTAPRLAVAADHGSLLERIKRMMGMDDPAAISAGGGPGPKAWLAGVLVLLIAVALPITLVAGDGGVKAGAEGGDAFEEMVDAEPDELEEEDEADAVPSVAKLVELAGIELTDGQADRSMLPGLWFQHPPQNRKHFYSLARRTEAIGHGIDGTVFYNTEQGVFYIEQGKNDLGEPLYYGPFAGNPLDLLDSDPVIKQAAVELVAQVIRAAQREDWTALYDDLFDVGVSMDERWVIPRAFLPALDLPDGVQPDELPVVAQLTLWDWHVVLLQNKEGASRPYTAMYLACNGERWGLMDSEYAPELGPDAARRYLLSQLSLLDEAPTWIRHQNSGLIPRGPSGSSGLGEEGQEINTLTHAVIVAAPDGTLATDFHYRHNQHLRGIMCSVFQRATDRNDVIRIMPHDSLRRSHRTRVGLTQLEDHRVALPDGVWVSQQDGSLVVHRPGQRQQRLRPGQRLRVDYRNDYALQVIEPQDIAVLYANVRQGQTREQIAVVLGLPNRGRDDLPHGWRWYGGPVAADPATTIYAPGAIAVRFVGDRVVEKRLSPAARQALQANQAENEQPQPAEAILGAWYGQFVDSSYLPSDMWCIWEFREDGKNSFTRGRYTADGEIDPGQGEGMVTDYAIDEQGRLLLYLPGEDTKVCPLEIRNGTAYISVDQPNDFVFSREPRPEQFRRDREAKRAERAERRVVIPDIDEPEGLEGRVLDLHNGELLNLPPRSNEQAVSKHFAELGQGDLAFEHASGGTFLITLRDATLRYGQDAERPENEAFGHGIAGYELLPSDEWVTVTTAEGEAYTLRIVENRGSDGLEIVYAPGTDVPELPAADPDEGQGVIDIPFDPHTGMPLDQIAQRDHDAAPQDQFPLVGRWVWCEDTIDNALAIAEFDGQGNLVLFVPDGGAEAYTVEASVVNGRGILKLTNIDPEGESVGLLTLRFVSEDRIVFGIGEGKGQALLYREDAYDRIKRETLRLRGLQGAGEDEAANENASIVGRWVVQADQVADWGVQSVEFEADGTGWEVRPSGERGAFNWRYDPEAGTLSAQAEDGTGAGIIWQATIEGDLLTLRREDRTVTLTRDDEPPATPQGLGEEGPGRPNEDAGASHPTFEIYVHADGLIRVTPGRSLVAVEELPGRIQAVDGFEDTAFLIFAHSDASPEYLGQVAQAIREAGAATSAVLNLRVAQDPLAGEAAGQDGPAHRIVMTVAMAEHGEVEVDGVGMLLHEMIGHIREEGWEKEAEIQFIGMRELPLDAVRPFLDTLRDAGYKNVQLRITVPQDDAPAAIEGQSRMLGLWYWSAGQADELTDLLGIEHRAGLLGLHIRGDGVITPIIGGEYDVTRDLVYDQLGIGALIGIRPHDAPGIAGQVRAWDIDFDAETGDLLILNGPEDSSFTRYARKPPVEHAVSGKEALLGVWHAQMDNGDYVRADEPAESLPGFVFREGPSGTLEMVVSRGGDPDWTEAVAVKLLTDPPNFSIHPQGAPEPMTAHYAVFGEALLIFDPSRDSGGLTLLCRTPRGTDPAHARRLRSVEEGALTIEEGQERMESVQIDGPIPEDIFTIRHRPGEMFYDSDLSKVIQDEHALLLEVIPASFDKQGEQAEAVNVPGKHQPVYRTGDALLTLVDVAEASVMQGELGQPVLQLIVKPDAAERLAAYTRQHLGEPLLIMVEGEPVSAPVVQGVLSDRVQVTGFDEHTQAAFESIIEAVVAGQQEDDEAADAGQADADSGAGQYISVIDVEGKPIAGAAVRLFGSIDGQSIQLSDGVAGADGRFEIPGDEVVRADTKWLRVGVEAEGFVSRWTTHGLQISRQQGPGLPEGQWYITVRDGEAVNNVVLLKSSVVTGRAFDRDGNPLAGAPISVSTYCDYEDYWQGEGRGPTTGFFVANHLRGISDENGDYRIEGVPPGNVVIYYPWDGPNMSEVREGRWAKWTQPGEQYPSPPDTERCWVRVLDLEEGEVVENLDIDLSKSTAVIEAVVVDQNDRPIQGAAVTPAWSRQGGHHSLHGGELPTPVTDAQGRVRIEHLPPGEVEVFVRVRDGAGREASSMTLELTEGATRQVRFKVMDIEQPADALEDDQQGAADDAGAGREADDEQGNHIAPEREHRDALLA